MTIRHAAAGTGAGVARPGLASAATGRGLRWTTGGLFVAGAVAFMALSGVVLDRLRRHPSRIIPTARAGHRDRLAVMSCDG